MSYEDYAGWSDISNSAITTKWLKQYKESGYTSQNANMKSVAYLLDTNQWSGFANKYAQYAIGGPTVELFVESYNQTHSEDINIKVSSENGYQVKWSGDTKFDEYIEGMDNTESLYVINDFIGAAAMWLASPSSYDIESVMIASGYGRVSYDEFNANNFGARPIVALNADVQIEKQADGTYKILELPGEAGIKEESVRYTWRKIIDGRPTADEITEIATQKTVTRDEQTQKVTEIQATINKNTDSGDDWILWVYAEDTLGNSKILCSNEFWLDNELPSVQADPEALGTTVKLKTDVTLILKDEYSGLDNENNSYEYYVSASKEALISANGESIEQNPQSYKESLGEVDNNGVTTATITIGNGETGERWLFVKAVKDTAGNESTQGEEITNINGINYHVFGPYIFDNEAPIGGGPNGEIFGTNGNTNWEKQHSTTVTLTETITL